MKVHIEGEFEGLGEALAEILPAGVEPTSVRVTQETLRVEGRGPFGIAVALTGRVVHEHGGVRVREIDLEGPAFVRAAALSGLCARIASLDVRSPPLRVRGEDEGRTLHVSWS
jgi:hypothetical protein